MTTGTTYQPTDRTSSTSLSEAQRALDAAPGKFVIIARKFRRTGSMQYFVMEKITNFLQRIWRWLTSEDSNYYTKKEAETAKHATTSPSLSRESSATSIASAAEDTSHTMTDDGIRLHNLFNANAIVEKINKDVGNRLFAILSAPVQKTWV